MPADTLTSGIDAFKRGALSCPLPAVVEIIGEKWAFLILRGALNGLKHFEEFQADSASRATSCRIGCRSSWRAESSSAAPIPTTADG